MKNKRILFLLMYFISADDAFSQEKYNGVDAGLSNIYRLSDAKSRSISPENFTGEKGKGGMALTGTGNPQPGTWERDGS